MSRDPGAWTEVNMTSSLDDAFADVRRTLRHASKFRQAKLVIGDDFRYHAHHSSAGCYQDRDRDQDSGLQDPDLDQDFESRLSRRLETKSQVLRTTSLVTVRRDEDS